MMVQQPQQGVVPVNEVPARVNAAMQFLLHLTNKTTSRIAITSIASEEYAGQVLSEPERTAHAAACELLTKYFRGTMPSDQFENLYGNAVQQMTGMAPQPVEVDCFCKTITGRAQPQCPVCRGAGKIIGRPTTESEE